MVVLNLNIPVAGEPSLCAVVPTGISAEPVLEVSITTPVSDEPDPENVVAPSTPVFELNVKLLPDLGARSPVAAVTNSGKQVVSLLSSATVTLVDVVAVAEFPVHEPELPDVFPVTFPVTFPSRFDTRVPTA